MTLKSGTESAFSSSIYKTKRTMFIRNDVHSAFNFDFNWDCLVVNINFLYTGFSLKVVYYFASILSRSGILLF